MSRRLAPLRLKIVVILMIFGHEGNQIYLEEEETKYAEGKERGDIYTAFEERPKKIPGKGRTLPPGPKASQTWKAPIKMSASQLQTAGLHVLEGGDVDFSLCFPTIFGTFNEKDTKGWPRESLNGQPFLINC